MGGRRREANGIFIICDNPRTGEHYICQTVKIATNMTGVKPNTINRLIKTGKQTRDGWTFDEWEVV